MLQELEGNFEVYSLQEGLTGEKEDMVAHPNFENVADRYHETSRPDILWGYKYARILN